MHWTNIFFHHALVYPSKEFLPRGIMFFMCGLFGYVGPKNASEVILEGLKRLEYRGYDSWGIAVATGDISLNKKVGSIGDLKDAGSFPKSNVAVGHTRWATHGGVSEVNAHPHFSTDKS